MCKSLRGGTYYGASLHITIGLLFLVGFFIDLLGIAEIWHNPYATYFSLCLSFLYIQFFIVFGLLLFRGAEKQSVRLLKGSLAGFIALQISAFVVYLVLLAVTNSARNSRIALSTSPVAPTPGVDDLMKIEAILQEASVELRNNNTGNIIEEINSKFATSNSNEIVDNSVYDDDQPIISLHQIALLVLGVVATVAYSSVVVMYVREVSGADVERA